MNETLYIENFLVIKKAELQLNKITLLIGPQASGKSLIAKLCYFFKSIPYHVSRAVTLQKKEQNMKSMILKDFYEIFPDYAWQEEEFLIYYQSTDYQVELKKSKAEKHAQLSLQYDSEKNYDEIKNEFSENLKEAIPSDMIHEGYDVKDIPIMLDRIMQISGYQHTYSNNFFIPAARSFFANLQNSIFNFMAHDIDIDPFVKKFGSFYEVCKQKHKQNEYPDQNMKTLMNLMSDVIQGHYQNIDDQDWIIQNNRKVNLAQASSGQQEALPLLLTLATYIVGHSQKNKLFFIEEPEAHLFPEAQSKVMAFFSHLYAEYQTRFFLTSHSPYILSALNNHILAAEIVEAGKMAPEKFTELNGYGVPIPFSDVAAYTICDGEVKSIRDEEYQMIGGDILDGISDHFGQVADALLDLRGE